MLWLIVGIVLLPVRRGQFRRRGCCGRRPPGVGYPQIAGLAVQGAAVLHGIRPLGIAEERLADMTEGDFLEVFERRDGGVLASALTGPNTK